MSIENDIKNNKILLISVKSTVYRDKIKELVSTSSGMFRKICYVTVNDPYKTVASNMPKVNSANPASPPPPTNGFEDGTLRAPHPPPPFPCSAMGSAQAVQAGRPRPSMRPRRVATDWPIRFVGKPRLIQPSPQY